jgi:hypothetical protein
LHDNAAVETFFKTIKAELMWRHPWETRRQAETANLGENTGSVLSDNQQPCALCAASTPPSLPLW